MTTTSTFDVVIAGGGPAGLATAIALRRTGLATLVVERSDNQGLRVGEHLPPSAKPLLRALGAGALIEADCHAPCPRIISAWGSAQPSEKHYIGHPYGDGVNLARPEFDLALGEYALGLGAVVLSSFRITAIRRAGDWHVDLASETGTMQVSARVLIDATGRAASIAKQLGARAVAIDEMVGIVGRTAPVGIEDVGIIIEATERGWWYSAGLADGSVVASFLTDAGDNALAADGRKANWQTALVHAPLTVSRCPMLAQIDTLHVRTARSQRLDRAVGDGWLAVGDAAMAFDPLSSEGISKGLVWARHAADAVVAWCGGDAAALTTYGRRVDVAFADYTAQRARYYAMERRWPQSPFWVRRQRSS